MKKTKEGSILMTKSELKEVIKNSATQLLNEMAVPLKFYRARVDGLRLQLVENWCLCKYCQKYDSDNTNFQHWIHEIQTHMDNIKSLNIKSGNKLNTLKKMLIDDYDFDDVNTIYRIVVGKFKREGINNVNIISEISGDFSNAIYEFVNALGVDSIITEEYLKDTFGLS